MMKALIESGGRVAQIVESGKEFPVHRELSWVDCGSDVRAGWRYEAQSETFIAPPPPLESDPRFIQDGADVLSLKNDQQVQTFLNFSPAQLDAWIATNVEAATTLAQLKASTAAALKILGRLAQQGARGRRLR